MNSLLIATRNAHKVQEIRAILGETYGYVTLGDVSGAPEVAEDAETFEGNALKKAEVLARWLEHQEVDTHEAWNRIRFVLADDSGLEVDALQGAPGVHSARFAAMDTGASGNSSDEANNSKLLRLLIDVPLERRSARFRCVLALAPVGQGSVTAGSQVFSGSCEGRIKFEPQGEHGFGYDPLFVPDGHEATFAELGDDIKNRISHRSKALTELRTWLRQQRQ